MAYTVEQKYHSLAKSLAPSGMSVEPAARFGTAIERTGFEWMGIMRQIHSLSKPGAAIEVHLTPVNSLQSIVDAIHAVCELGRVLPGNPSVQLMTHQESPTEVKKLLTDPILYPKSTLVWEGRLTH